MSDCEAIQEQLSAWLDDELTQQDAQRIGVHLRACRRCRETVEDFARLRGDIQQLPLDRPPAEQWSMGMARLSLRATRGVGWLLWGGGAATLAAYGVYAFASDPAVRAIERVGVLAVILGAVLLFCTVLAERIAGYSRDKYKDVER